MKELSLNILDISENSIRAGATLIEILLDESDDILTITIKDNGCGMSKKMIDRLIDPFFTTRTTRSIGLGIPLYKMAAEQTGGFLNISSSQSPTNHGTIVQATFHKSHIDCAPLGDIITTIVTLIQGAPKIDYIFQHRSPQHYVEFNTKQIREILGNIPLNTPDVLLWIRENLTDQYQTCFQKIKIHKKGKKQ